jgi:hypothetical protein
MARDLFSRIGRCRYCDRPATIRWTAELATCTHEVCQSLAFSRLRRRNQLARLRVA